MTTDPRLTIDHHLDPDDLAGTLQDDAAAGLTANPKWLPAKWFYDARGSDLFEQITQLPEYYPTRAEREILRAQADRIAAASGADTLVELGSGSSEKTRLLLDALHRTGSLRRYVPVDVSDSALLEASQALLSDYPELSVHGVVADFTRHLELIPGGGRRMTAFLGGTIGNLMPAERVAFLSAVRAAAGAGDTLLLGTDLVKDPAVLVAAYDDAAGVTAEFNKNVLNVLNRGLGADFDPDTFRHEARWDPEQEWIEMWLCSVRAQTVKVRALDLAVEFVDGEGIRTEISAKFRRAGVAAELAAAGFELQHWWTDAEGRFALSLAVPI